MVLLYLILGLHFTSSWLIVNCHCRYTMIKHQHEEANKANPERFNMLKRTEEFQKTDGLNLK